ncbi:MAG: hypothetical protein Q6352_002360 [Candidatus Freyrarchaeum guaymaensis]
MVIPRETWKTFELTGEENESILVEFVAAWSKDYEKLFSIGREVKCKTIKYTTLTRDIGTGILVPKQITQEFGIRMNHYLEAILKKVIKDEEEIEIFPKREVFEHYPVGFERKSKEE